MHASQPEGSAIIAPETWVVGTRPTRLQQPQHNRALSKALYSLLLHCTDCVLKPCCGLLTPLLKQKLQDLGARGKKQTERTAARAAVCCQQQMLPNPPSALPCQSSALMHGKGLAYRPWGRGMAGFLGTKCRLLAGLSAHLHMPAPSYLKTSPAITR